MGSKCAPALAYIYLSILEKRFLNLYNPFYYYKYIDDIFTVFDENDSRFCIELIDYFKIFGVNLISNSNNHTVFLDLI